MGVPRFFEALRRKGLSVLTIDHDCGLSILQTTAVAAPLTRS